ncbi:MAG TPA: papain-like cysteine protease family protein [Pyrinomonadaceae bacterium]|nr:papain-like cysteine protease family protein [Pyrinomonadaceae bacterium]
MAMTKVSPEVVPQNQNTKAACWYFCLRMMFQWKRDAGDINKDPEKILELMDKSARLYPYEMRDKWGIAPDECRETARTLGLTATGDGEIDAGVLEDTLKTKGPIWIAGDWGLGNHVIVITGCEPATGKIRFINPYQNLGGTDSPGTISWLNDREKNGNLWKSCDASVMTW